MWNVHDIRIMYFIADIFRNLTNGKIATESSNIYLQTRMTLKVWRAGHVNIIGLTGYFASITKIDLHL